MEKLYKNEYLFSEIYLKEITKIKEDSSIVATLSTLKEYREYAHFETLEEWNRSFVHEVLKALKFGIKIVDENVSYVYQIGKPDENISICYSLLPSEDLENTSMGKNWAEKIIRNLKKNAFKWGILTNGDKWRIYYTEEVTPYENYLEIDLKGTLDSDNVLQFQIFYKFMKAENFTVDKQGSCLFDVFKKESQDRIDYIEEELKNALKQKEEGGKGILSNLCLGYTIDLRKSGHLDFSDDNLRNIYGSAMLYMFRLLFLFYSEARGLLKDKALEAFLFVLETAKNNQEKSELNKDSYELWMNLSNIFANIDLTYNGGLFNPSENKYTTFLEDNKISDIYLTPVLYYMTYYEDKSGNYSPISYRDMGVRHLGTLYEGLLEHKLFVAEEDVEVQVSKKEVKFIPTSAGGKIIKGKYISKGYIYFGTDKVERKASGSYYTPEDVVNYIVANTVDKKLNELKDEFIKHNKRLLELFKTSISDSERQSISALIADKLEEFIRKRILKLSVLDPTMGSGHFLVNATNHITNFIVAFLNDFSESSSSINTNPMYWRRRVVENCIYGVDLNPLAVELAKLCLWITTAFKEKPLSFLNHHLKQGNALVGIRISDIKEFLKNSKQVYYDLFSQSYLNIIDQVARGYREELATLTEAKEDINEKKELLDNLDKKLYPYKNIYDFFTNVLLGKIENSSLWPILNNWNLSSNFQNSMPYLDNKDFFHWDLEFPDVFNGFDPGFDCVIGNPPYVGHLKRNINYNLAGYATQSCSNLFAYTVERAFSILKDMGKVSMILPLSAFSTKNMETFKEFVISKSETVYLSFYHFRPARIFEGANLPVCILISKKGSNCKTEMYTTGIYKWQQQERKYLFENIKYIKIDPKAIDTYNNFYYPKLMNQIENGILLKILKHKPIINYKKEKVELANPNNIHYRTAGGLYWKIITNFKFPYESTSNKVATIKDQYLNNVFVSILNSNTFWWYYSVAFDTLNLKDYLIFGFRFTYEQISSFNLNKLNELCELLMKDYLLNAKHTNRKNTKCYL